MQSIPVTIRIQRCTYHNKDKDLFSQTQKNMFCEQCVTDNKLNASELVDSKEYCLKEFEKWKKLRNFAYYLKSEHEQKEKEYGIPWRSSFKVEIRNALIDMRNKLFGKTQIGENEDVFDAIVTITANSKQDAESFYQNTQADMILTLNESYVIIERQVLYLKKLLKEPELKNFAEIKSHSLGQ